MEIYKRSETGRVRKINQDFAIEKVFGEYCAFIGVFDGVGGIQGGETASHTAGFTICSYIEKNSEALCKDNLEILLKQAFNEANEKIIEKGRETDLIGLSTTAVAALIFGSTVCVAHIGDSRAYLLDETKFKQITVDHSVVQKMIESGGISENEAMSHPNKNLITRALGMENSDPEINFFIMSQKDKLLLCTDGLTNYAENEKIESIMRQNSTLKETAENLINFANESGGSDNITVALIRLNGGMDFGQEIT
ncbi:MAG: Stp1/IreP family PP2C-type Ser/Thr phosphatase [Oscillospiraceae bacterium]|nr:Stp1/IreP family PP2C-type Ser/Thr phosphatase [Oscillospiraceae bacterium]